MEDSSRPFDPTKLPFGTDFPLFDETSGLSSAFNYECDGSPTENNWLLLSTAEPLESHSQQLEPALSSKSIFDLYGDDEELEDAESSVEDLLFSLPEQSELGSLLPYSTESSSDNLFLTREVSVESRLSSATSISSKHFRIPFKSKWIMDSWMGANADSPYLKQGDAEALAHLTTLTPAQVKIYIANARLRRPIAALSQASSTRSLPSHNSSSSLGPRKGRKRFRASTTGSADTLSCPPRDPSRRYQCTFCYQPFTRKGDWKRHEQASHVPQEEWICLPDFPTFFSNDGTVLCAFCEIEAPDEEHLQEVHRYQSCLNKPQSQRTFNRKDKLRQHVAQVHKQLTLSTHAGTAWVRSLNQNLRFQCGFCTESLVSWNSRSDHIALHFENGLDMSSWQGSLGGILD